MNVLQKQTIARFQFKLINFSLNRKVVLNNYMVMDQCVHINEAVDLSKLVEVLDNSYFEKQCDDCTQVSDSDGNCEISIWMCLKCGHQGCGRYFKEHALKHVSDTEFIHALCVDVNNWNVWCYKCDDEINIQCQENLRKCIEYIKNSKAFTTNQIISIKELIVPDVENVNCNSHLPIPPGLRNLGNTCYFNSAMQCLGRTPYLLHLLEEIVQSEKLILDNHRTPEKWGPITNALVGTLSELANCQTQTHDPAVLHSRFCERVPLFRGYRQQDSQELIRHLLEVVSEEIRRQCEASGAELVQPIDQVFGGTMISTLKCRKCMHTSHRREVFLDLSVPISYERKLYKPKKNKKTNENSDSEDDSRECSESGYNSDKTDDGALGELQEAFIDDGKEGVRSVESCLKEYTSREFLTDDNKVACDQCTARNGSSNKVYTNTTKQLLVCNPPAVLIVHLKRFEFTGSYPTKIGDFVSFPALLDLAPFCYKTSACGKIFYSLYGVVEHSGSVFSGHYIAYVKSRRPLNKQDRRWQFLDRNQKPNENKKIREDANSKPNVPAGDWYYISDSHVSKSSETNVLNAQAYLLFYERLL